jgi:hypothetical protein
MTTQEIAINMVLNAWRSGVNELDKLLTELSDDQLLKEISPGRNRGIYILGHLVVLLNNSRPLMGYGEDPTPHLVEPFVKMPDREAKELPPVAEIRHAWHNARTAMENNIALTPVDEWFKKHTAISAEDFQLEPHRNKLNVILLRIPHLSHHIGQLTLLKSKG